MKKNSKIFCVGLNKTGTSSLHEAFQILGFKSVHFYCEKGNIKDIIENNYKNGDDLLLGISNYDAYLDWNHPSTNHLYKEFDQQYPGSKFILNTRNMEDWLQSREKHVLRDPNLKKKQYLYPEDPWYNINKEAWKIEFENLHKDVLEYFKNREKDLLIFNVADGDSWEKLCPFLGLDILDGVFPMKNKAPKKSYLRKVKNFLRLVKNYYT